MRIAIGGIMHESNTSLPLRTGRRQFEESSLTCGEEVLRIWGDAHHEMGGFIDGAKELGYELAPTIMAWAMPAGPVVDTMLDEMVPEIAEGCRRTKADGLLLALHGAMVAESYPSGDSEILRRLRAALGPAFPIVTTLDFHANVSPVMAECANALVGYQTNPHVDQRQRGRLAAELMVRTLRGEIRPVTAVAKPPLIMNIMKQDTAKEPLRSLLQAAREAERQPGMLSVSLMAGFPYADVPDMGPSVIAVADGDGTRARQVAEQLGERIWAVREGLTATCPEAADAVRQALAAATPVVLVDTGDNVGGGSAGDGTVLLAELLRQKVSGAVVTLFAPEAVAAARAAGPGGKFEQTVGGAVDRHHGDPVFVRGIVRSLHEGKWIENEIRHGGLKYNDQGATAVIDIEGPNTLVLNSLRTPPFSLGQLTSLGIEPRRCRVLVVKAAIAYKAAYAPIAGTIIEVDTPGLTAINPARYDYRNIRRPMFPLAK